MRESLCSKCNAHKKIALGILMLVFNVIGVAQNQDNTSGSCKLGGAIELVSAGNCHGSMFSPLLSVNNKRHSVFAGAFIQKRNNELVGGRFGYSLNLTEGCSRNSFYDEEEMDSLYTGTQDAGDIKPFFFLSAFVSAQYYHHALLSRSAAMIESRTSRDNATYDWSSYRMSTAEIAAGVELNFRLSKRITWKNTVGVSVYNHLDYSRPMNTAKIAPTLMLGTGIHVCPL